MPNNFARKRADGGIIVEKPNIPSALPAWARCIADYAPRDAREAAERQMMLDLIALQGDALLSRDSLHAHMTSSSMIFNRERTKVLMAYHRIYQSWAWTGGHNDGETDFLGVAMREAREETDIITLRPICKAPASLEVLYVCPHIKRGKQVGTHLHFNVSYLLEADETEPLRIAEDENSAVGWVKIEDVETAVSEPFMRPIYAKLIERANIC